MDVTTQRRCLTTLAGGLLLGTVGSIGWSLSGIDQAAKPATTTVPAIAKESEDSDGRDKLTDAGLNIALRRPLTDPPPPLSLPEPLPAASRPPSTAKLQLTLVGTIIESGKSLAIIADSSGEFDVKGVGEALELTPVGVSVKRIDSEQVELQYRGKTSTVRLDRDVKKSGGGRRAEKTRRREQ